MKQAVLIIYPGKPSFIGLWQARYETWQTQAYDHKSESVLSVIESLLHLQGLALRDVTHIGVFPGPASYTELRVLLATANSLAWANQLPMFSLTTSDTVPDVIPQRLAEARVNIPLEPIYPTTLEQASS